MFLFFKTSSAEILKPNTDIDPKKVVKIQLIALMKNDNPYKDYGIIQTWEFAHPNNQKNTGPFDRFKAMIKGKSYGVLLNHLDHKIVEIKSLKRLNSLLHEEIVFLLYHLSTFQFYLL